MGKLPYEFDNSSGMQHVVTLPDVLHIKLWDEFDIDFCLTFLNFETSSMSNGLVNTIIPVVPHMIDEANSSIHVFQMRKGTFDWL